MPCSSIHYSVARIKVLEKKILNNDKIERMLSAQDAGRAFKVLIDSEYGGVPAENPRDFEQMIKSELRNSYELISKITPDEDLSDVFILRYDYQNAKAYLKMRVTGTDEDNAVTDAGKYDAKELREMIFEHDTKGLPEHLAKAINEALKQINIGTTPQKLDTLMDTAYIKYCIDIAKKKKSPFLLEYVQTKIDFANILMMLRVRKMEADFDMFSAAYDEGGLIEFKTFKKAYSQTDEAVPKFFKNTKYSPKLEKKIEEALQKKQTWIFGKYMENTLTAIVGRYNKNIFSVEPVVGYLMEKENEAKVIRLIMTGKLNNMSQDTIKERLRDIYV
ncbi:MAG: V-type ATPase subunit [Eubacteriales bacterium]